MIDDISVIKEILNKNGFRWQVISQKKVAQKENKDVVKRSVAGILYCLYTTPNTVRELVTLVGVSFNLLSSTDTALLKRFKETQPR